MGDYLVRALGFNNSVRAFAVSTTETVGEAQRRHDTWPTTSAALGRTMTASVMMGAMLKGEDKITVKVEGNGPIGSMIVDANAQGEVRGYVTNPHVEFDLNPQGKLDVRRAVGTEGALTVVKDLGLRDFFSGQVPIVSGEIAEDFTYYFATSEQVPSSVGLGVLVNTDDSILAAGGFIIQLLPGVDDETITQIENQLSKIEPVSKMIQKGFTPEEILKAVLGEDNVQMLDTMPVKFECSCSKERFGAAILSLGEKEIRDMIEEDGKAEAHCHFCQEKYQYSKEELEGFITEINS
ncbi:Hsp33 family molecular chaperone HslO [Viridibacillus sp. FSL R5-0477]|uniref:33 kDa chaperonin n=1 Tax=Viridibacillus arenosi FSL R5-213 TaxID=1227360 RepID=W4F898_9BACL|nr:MULTISPECIES: Hsp33 family molecular chaperone HslO [Viridibacillus]ETT88351.1 chaperonin HSP33 [Viridibacillus arenosi FSL R5-213]OMC78367.1 molecular chaperone Hsp33 [Viridibacillus sp. FSL H8-0123]OMC81922.1 molecular chaperone Hsp33 [Viridibacillus sp. FSL H7-0596]OMC87585.1 molecular chaperone Hsp33 [Viridibacillus arenosi]